MFFTFNNVKIYKIKLVIMTYYTIYQTTNLITNKIYIGLHVTKNPMDSY